MQNQDYKQKYFALLGEVEKPARYAGGEWNIPDMNKKGKGIWFLFSRTLRNRNEQSRRCDFVRHSK